MKEQQYKEILKFVENNIMVKKSEDGFANVYLQHAKEYASKGYFGKACCTLNRIKFIN